MKVLLITYYLFKLRASKSTSETLLAHVIALQEKKKISCPSHISCGTRLLLYMYKVYVYISIPTHTNVFRFFYSRLLVLREFLISTASSYHSLLDCIYVYHFLFFSVFFFTRYSIIHIILQL